MMNKLAIVIPYFKIDFFEKCLESLSRQSNKNFKVYIGDDCSSNNPKELVESYLPILKISYTRFSTNLGGSFLTKQWDRCIELIQDEEWIMLLGDDDMISENLVEGFYRSLSEINAGDYNVARANVIEINEFGETLRTFEYPKLEKASTSYIKKLTENYHISLPEYIFRKTSYQKYGFRHFPYAFGSDNVAWLEFAEGRSIYTIPETWCLVRKSDFSISGSGTNIKEKMYAMYLTKKYIIFNLFNDLTSKDQAIIISIAYQNLLYSNKKGIKERLFFIFKTTKHLSLRQFYKFFLK